MLETLGLSWLLLPLGAVLGWYLARQQPLTRPPSAVAGAPAAAGPEYLAGLTSLLNEDPDQALSILVRAVEADPATIDLQLLLGALFRKRGEVDRALRLHESLLTRPGLRPEQMAQARLELAQDYLKAGVIDRAETLFQQLIRDGAHVPAALEQLLFIQEQAHEWDRAISVAEQLEPLKGRSLRPLMAQYRCEQADQARLRKDPAAALRHAQEALSTDAQCVRASLLLGALHEAAGELAAAVKAWRRVPEQDARFLSEVMEPLQKASQKLGETGAFLQFLDDAEHRWPQPAPMLARARLMLAEGQDPTVYLANRLQKQPNWAGLDLLFQGLARQSEALAPTIEGLRAALRRTYENVAAYRCSHCGLQARLLFWQCPSCKQWATVVPALTALQAG